MNKTLTVILLLFSKIIFAQDYYPPIPTQFDAFINQPSIEWAAYANDSVRFDKINFNKLLVKRFEKRQIKVTYAISDLKQTKKISFVEKKSLDKDVLYLYPCMPIIGPNGDYLIKDTIELEPRNLDTLLSSRTNVKQIVYIEKGTLKSYITWISPAIVEIVTSTGINLGCTEYFSTCFNFKYNHTLGKQKAVFLSETKRKISLDSFDTTNKLKELYGRNLIETLWPNILKNKIKSFSFNDNVQLNAASINTSLLGERIAPVDLYDASGNIAGTKVIEEPLSPKNFTAIELIQDWYYDYKQNMVFNKIRYAHLYAKKWKKQVQDNESSPVIKIIF